MFHLLILFQLQDVIASQHHQICIRFHALLVPCQKLSGQGLKSNCEDPSTSPFGLISITLPIAELTDLYCFGMLH